MNFLVSVDVRYFYFLYRYVDVSWEIHILPASDVSSWYNEALELMYYRYAVCIVICNYRKVRKDILRAPSTRLPITQRMRMTSLDRPLDTTNELKDCSCLLFVACSSCCRHQSEIDEYTSKHNAASCTRIDVVVRSYSTNRTFRHDHGVSNTESVSTIDLRSTEHSALP